MLQPPGFSQRAVVTSLGTMAYYTAERAPWRLSDERSTERPSLVFFHGFGGGSSAYEWSKVYPAFAFEYNILAPDLLGWGRSDHLSRDYQIEDYLVTLREFLEQTCTEPVTVVASSLTAGFMIQLAIEYPQLFKSLILCAPSGLSDFGREYKDSFFARLVSIPVFDRLLYNTAIATNAGIRGFLSNRQFARPHRVSQDIVDAYLASAQLPNADYTALSFVRGDLCFDLAEFIPKLTTPTAIIWGKQAQLTEYTIGEKLARLNPQAIRFLEILDDVGLTPQLELPAVMIGVMRQFLKGL
jgi:pimeloyl-ACP methyl ester carboxylesterase